MKADILVLCNKAGKPVELSYSLHRLLTTFMRMRDKSHLVLKDEDFKQAEVLLKRKRWSIRHATLTVVLGENAV